MNWLRITVKTTTEGSDVISEVLSEVSAGGVIIEDKEDLKNYDRPKEQWDYIDEELMDAYGDEVLVRGFAEETDTEAENFVRESIKNLKILIGAVWRYFLNLLKTKIGAKRGRNFINPLSLQTK